MGGGPKKRAPKNRSVGGGSEFIYFNKVKMEGYSTITTSRLYGIGMVEGGRRQVVEGDRPVTLGPVEVDVVSFGQLSEGVPAKPHPRS
jgi:hypothetical protein